jgi:hypothetical protein
LASLELDVLPEPDPELSEELEDDEDELLSLLDPLSLLLVAPDEAARLSVR